MKPTKDDYATAKRVLQYLRPKAVALADYTEQERPSEWLDGIGSVLTLLEDKDPEKVLANYRAEYDAGR